MTNDLAWIYQRRFGRDLEFRKKMWAILCRDFFQRFVPENASVLDLASGYCEFINHIRAGRKTAIDLNSNAAQYAGENVQFINSRSTDLSAIESDTLDIVFASNFFEHITKEDIVLTLREVRRVLRKGGHVLILQPNIRICYRDYWMFFDHITPLDDRSICEILETGGYTIKKLIPRFLPFTVQNRLPRSPLLVSIYLKLPFLWNIFGAQVFVMAEK